MTAPVAPSPAGTVAPMRSFVLVLLLASLAVGCASAPVSGEPSPAVDGRAVALARVTDAVADVAAAQAEADPMLATALAGVRELDVLVARLRDAETVDAAKDTWPRVDGAVQAVELEPLRPRIREIAFAVDRARAALSRASEGLEDDWETRYLAAQDETLAAMRTYAEEADALAQVLARHWPTYDALAELTATFVEQRWFYRDAEEAAAAYEVAIAEHREDLARAQDEIRRFRERRDEAGRAVNTASAAAAEVFRSRPRPTATP